MRSYTSFIDFNDASEELVYCDRCSSVGIKSKLGPRVLEADQPIPSDYNQWMQCYNCGKITSVNSVKHESKLIENINVQNKPTFTSLESNKKRKHAAGIKRYSSRLGINEKDKEIKELIRKYGDRVTVHQ